MWAWVLSGPCQLQTAQKVQAQANVQSTENKAVAVELINIIAELQQMLPRTFDSGSAPANEDQNTSHASATLLRFLLTKRHALKNETEKIDRSGLPVLQGASASNIMPELVDLLRQSSELKSAGASKHGSAAHLPGQWLPLQNIHASNDRTKLPIQPGASAAHLPGNWLAYKMRQSSELESAGASRHGSDDGRSPGGGADPPGKGDPQDDSYVDKIPLTSYMQAFRMALTKEYMQRMNETQHPGHEYTLRVACSADRFMTIENINQWNNMLVQLCTGKYDTFCCSEDCSHKFEFVIVCKKKSTNQWERLPVSSVSVDVTGHFLTYIADAVWHLHRRLAWKKRLIDFLEVKHADLIGLDLL